MAWVLQVMCLWKLRHLKVKYILKNKVIIMVFVYHSKNGSTVPLCTVRNPIGQDTISYFKNLYRSETSNQSNMMTLEMSRCQWLQIHKSDYRWCTYKVFIRSKTWVLIETRWYSNSSTFDEYKWVLLEGTRLYGS